MSRRSRRTRSLLVTVSLGALVFGDRYVDLARAAKGPVTIRCVLRDDGHRVELVASSTLNKTINCHADCSHQGSNGITGKLECDAAVPAKAKDVVICSHTDHDPAIKFNITNPGNFKCH